MEDHPPENETTAEAIRGAAALLNDGESMLGCICEQLERIADSLEALEKRGRPDPMHGYGL